MTAPADAQPADAQPADAARDALRLSRGITATWWYTASGVVFVEVILILVWSTTVLDARGDAAVAATVGFSGLAWVGATIPLLLDYRYRPEGVPAVRWRRAAAPLAIAVAAGIVGGAAAGSWTLAALPAVQALVLLDWGPGIRRRVVVAATVLIAALAVIDSRVNFPPETFSSGMLAFLYSVLLPALTVVSLWWWDVLVALDRARASEARLAATQERLRLATDVHDLQGHHLQVIALQLELAERLLSTDPAAAGEQLRAARVSVDEARQGTRDLATRFRGVPLRDELANAVDLLEAAGITTELVVAADVDAAPSSVLGPVIRETTTNVLRHGAGSWARLSLARDGADWRFEIANDAASGEHAQEVRGGGSGLDGIRRRAAEEGGTLDVRRGAADIAVVVTVPARPGRGDVR